MLRVATLLSAAALFSADAVRASAVSHSVFPNSACAGAASGALAGLVGVGKIVLSNGDVESHCGCISDNLAEFELCPSSATGQAVCNSALDLKTNAFTASDCVATVVNKVVVDEDECYNAEKGATGIVTIDGEAKCGCASDDADNFSPCAAPANGRALCVATDADFLGASQDDVTKVECSVQCDEGFFLTPGGSCTKLAKRNVAGPSGAFHSGGPGKVGPSSKPHGSQPATATPTSRHPHHAHTTSPSGAETTTTSYSYKHHHHSSPPHHGTGTREPWASVTSRVAHGSSKPHGSQPATGTPTTSRHPHHAHPTSPSGPGSETTTTRGRHHHHSSRPHHAHPTSPSGPGSETTTTRGRHHHTSRPHHSSRPHHGHGHPSSSPAGPIKVIPSSPAAPHHPHGHSTRPHHGHHSSVPTTGGPGPVGPSPTTRPAGPSASFTEGPGKVGPSQIARRAAEEFVFSDVCAQDERTCAVGEYGDFNCVRLDDVTECGGCNASGDATNCLEIVGASSVACLRGGCVVRSCQTGYVQTSEGTCELKA
ncbi:hypothetical protein JCM3770_004213 [Rhodotorula araucariae]